MKKLHDIREMVDLEVWEVWLYGVVLPVGFFLAALIGSVL